MVGDRHESLNPIAGAARSARRRLGLRGELTLALLPTLTVISVLWLVETLAAQRLLFGALAASAFLIYLDPLHGTNTIRTLVAAHLVAIGAGFAADWALGSGYGAAAVAMVATILVMIPFDVVHPPAISTSMSFAFRADDTDDAALFLLALGMVVVLVLIQRMAQHLLGRLTRRADEGHDRQTTDAGT